MSNGNDGEFGAFLAGFVIGGLVGAAAALILAPQSGEETRSLLATQSASLRDLGTDRLQEYRGRTEETVSHVQEQARIVLDEGKSRLGMERPAEEQGDMPPDPPAVPPPSDTSPGEAT